MNSSGDAPLVAAVVADLIAIGFSERDARGLIAKSTPEAVRVAMESAALKDSKGELRKGRRAYVVAAVRDGYSPDERLAKAAQKKAAQESRLAAMRTSLVAVRQEDERVAANLEQITRELRALPPERLEQIRRQALNRMPSLARAAAEEVDPFSRRDIVVLMSHEHRSAS
jgi:uncharacterized coiled-coil protein SlyX